MNGNILVLSEHKDGQLDGVTLELIGKGRAIADSCDTKLAVLVIGDDIDRVAEGLKESGVDIILTAKAPALKDYSAELYTTVLSEAVKTFNPELVLMGYTYLGMEVGPAAAIRCKGSMVSNCTALDLQDGTLIGARNIFGGTLQATIEFAGQTPYFVSMEKGILPKEQQENRNAVVEALGMDLASLQLRSKIIEIFSAVTGDVDITKAKILVSVGRGIGGPEKLQQFKDLAAALDGELSCSRPVADMGWLPIAHQVGISAATVSPAVYLAFGISGASQHVTAMRDANTIIAINNDPKAPIFRVADYGIVGDAMEVAAAMLETARA